MSLRHLPAAGSVLLLVLASPVSVRSALGVSAEQRQGRTASLTRVFSPPAKTGIVKGLNPNILLSTLAKEQGLRVQRDKAGGGQAEPLREGELSRESLSLTKAPNLERWGPKFMLRKEDHLIGGLQIGVFADPNTAALAFVDQIHHTSVGPSKRFGPELGDEAVGWWDQKQQGFDLVLLRRSNVVASIDVLLGGAGKVIVPPETPMALALRLDQALQAGSDGVSRDTTLTIPRILAVETDKVPVPRREQHARVRITMPTRRLPEKPGMSEVVYDVPFHPPAAVGDAVLPDGELRWELVHITPDCLVSTHCIKVDPVHLPSMP